MDIQETFGLFLILALASYGFIISAFTIGLVRLQFRKWSKTHQPVRFISVVIPVRNEACNILRILEEMRSQDFPGDRMEIIVTDDYSEDATMAFAGRFAHEHPAFPLILVPSGREEANATGKKRAIERAVAKAKGEVLLFTDADTWRGPGWISSMVSGFGSSEIQMALGPVYFCHEKSLLQKIQSLEFLGLMGTTAGSAALGFPVMCNGANLAYRRNAFLSVGGFSGNLIYGSGDDQFMMSSIKKLFGGASLIFNADPLSAVGTEPEATLRGFLNQRIRWVSKSRGYRDPVVVIVGAIMFLTHLTLLAGMLAGFFFPKLFFVSILLWLVKILLEYPMVWIMTRFFGKGKLTKYYFIAQVFQLIYIPLAGMLGLFLQYRWKGRTG